MAKALMRWSGIQFTFRGCCGKGRLIGKALIISLHLQENWSPHPAAGVIGTRTKLLWFPDLGSDT